MNSIIKRLMQLFNSQPEKMQGNHTMITKLMRMISMTEEEEYSCDDVYDLIDQYAEIIARGEDADHMMPLIKHHLDMCVDCREEYESLLSVISSLSV
jgi:hypothetical protein